MRSCDVITKIDEPKLFSIPAASALALIMIRVGNLLVTINWHADHTHALRDMNCPHCQKELPEGYKASVCPECLENLSASPASDPAERSTEKVIAWVIFWLAFIGTPIITFGLAINQSNLFFGVPIAGAVVAGFALAKVFAKSMGDFIARGILFSFLVVVVYVGIIFIGCVAMLSR